MNYQLFSTFTFEEIQATKAVLQETIDQNFRHQMLDAVSQYEYDNLKKIIRQLDNARYYKLPTTHTA